MHKLNELLGEFRSVFSGKVFRILESLLPLVVFLIVNPLLGLNPALWAALALAGTFAFYRLIQRQSLVYAFGGLGSVLLALVFVQLSGSGAGFFIPGLISGAVTVALCVVTVMLNRPMVAWTSYLTRRWPLGWYWHPQVLPAYNEVTILWAVAFATRLALDFTLYQRGATVALSTSRLILGWPFIIVLLIITYLYGLWRLKRLGGPSVDEYSNNIPPPWQGQQRGF